MCHDILQLQSSLINENYSKKSLTQKHNNLRVGYKKQQTKHKAFFFLFFGRAMLKSF